MVRFEILVEVELAGFERRTQHMVTALKIVAVQAELLHQPGALELIPAVGQQHAAHVGKHGGDFRHVTPPLLSTMPDRAGLSEQKLSLGRHSKPVFRRYVADISIDKADRFVLTRQPLLLGPFRGHNWRTSAEVLRTAR